MLGPSVYGDELSPVQGVPGGKAVGCMEPSKWFCGRRGACEEQEANGQLECRACATSVRPIFWVDRRRFNLSVLFPCAGAFRALHQPNSRLRLRAAP